MGGVDKQIEVSKVEHNIGGIATRRWVFGCSWTCVRDAIRLHVSWNNMSSANASNTQMVKSKCSKWPFFIFFWSFLIFLFIKSPPKKKKHEKITAQMEALGFTRIPWISPPIFVGRQSYGSSSHLIPCLEREGWGLDPVMWLCCDTTTGHSNRRFSEFSSFVEQASCSNKNLAGKVILWDLLGENPEEVRHI